MNITEAGRQSVMDIKEMEAIVEGVLFAAGDPVPLAKIAEILELDKATANGFLTIWQSGCRIHRGAY